MSSHKRPQYKIKYARVMPSGQVRFRKRFKDMMTDAATRISGVILREAIDDVVPVTSIDRVQRQANSILTGLFGGQDAVSVDGRPQSPYARALLEEVGKVTYGIVRAHQSYLIDVASPEVLAWLRSGIVPPIREMVQLSELTADEVRRRFPSLDEDDVQQVANNRLFDPNPLAQYEPAHTWVDPNGYRLSERIWQTDQRTRAKLDGLVADLIASGTSAREISQLTERFLIPGREKIRTNRPHGSDASYDGMRLGRTEISHAGNQAAYISAQQNPYVDRFDVIRSASGDPTCPICPQHATIGITGARLRPAYRLSEARLSPFHPHCVTPGQLVTTRRGKIPIEDVEIGDYVLTHKGRFRKVLNAWSKQYSGPVHDIQTGHSRVELTSEHPVLSSSGWIDAELVKPGEQILHAIIDAGPDFVSGVSESAPSQSGQVSIPAGVSFGVVPMDAVTLDSYLASHKGEINLITPDTILAVIMDICSVESLHHGFFDTVGDAFTPHTKQFSTSDFQAGVISLLDSRDFLSDFWALCRIIVASQIKSVVDFLEHLTGHFRSGSVVMSPLGFDRVASVAHLETVILHEASKASEGHTELFGRGVCSVLFNEIKPIDDFFSRFSEFLGDALDMFEVMLLLEAVLAKSALALYATARAGGHDNLLSLSPGYIVGAEPGSSVVGQVANLSQAHLNYISVENVAQRNYQGLVYNMTVEEDESYVVNDVVVHNCMCRGQSVAADDVQVVEDQLRNFVLRSRETNLRPYMNPAQAEAFTQRLLGDALWAVLRQVLPEQPLLL